VQRLPVLKEAGINAIIVVLPESSDLVQLVRAGVRIADLQLSYIIANITAGRLSVLEFHEAEERKGERLT
jgi:hypothetical protein